MRRTPREVFETLHFMHAARHPQAAVMSGALQAGIARAANSGAAEAAQQKAAEGMVNGAVAQATAGVVKDVPPEARTQGPQR